jgi:class 3 adenylate cyclase
MGTDAGNGGTAKGIAHDLLLQVSQSLKVGMAVVDAAEWTILFENACFFRWFPPDGDDDDSLAARLPGFKPATAQSRIDDERSYSFETEAHETARRAPVRVEVRAIPSAAKGCVLVECQDISKQKQSEYMLASYSDMAEKNARELQREKERVEKLLLNVMPRSVYEEMREFGTVTPQLFDEATILMLDFVGSTEMAVSSDPVSLIGELNDMFLVFDRIADQFGCERIRTVGDAYIAVSGLPETTSDHAANVARLALRIRRYIERRNEAHPEKWQCRIGINSGAVIGSLVGVQKYVYDIFGPGINLASRMESISEAMQITASERTYELLRDEFEFEDRGEFELKGFGKMKAYFLLAELPRRR